MKKNAFLKTITSFVMLAGGYTALQAEPNHEPISDEGIVAFFEVFAVQADDALNIRKSPDPKSHEHQVIVGQIPASQTCVVSLNKKEGQWVKVTHKGVQGWANSRNLRHQDQGCGTYYLVTNVFGHLNQRQFPNYDPTNKKVGKILAEEQDCIIGLDKVTKGRITWVMLQYEGVNGWVNSQYVREIKIDTDDYEDYCDM